jgi:hypothetical protein
MYWRASNQQQSLALTVRRPLIVSLERPPAAERVATEWVLHPPPYDGAIACESQRSNLTLGCGSHPQKTRITTGGAGHESEIGCR